MVQNNYTEVTKPSKRNNGLYDGKQQKYQQQRSSAHPGHYNIIQQAKELITNVGEDRWEFQETLLDNLEAHEIKQDLQNIQKKGLGSLKKRVDTGIKNQRINQMTGFS